MENLKETPRSNHNAIMPLNPHPLQATIEPQTFYCVDSGDGTQASPFWLTDVSARGARLMGRSVSSIPDTFLLRVKGHEDGLWRCQVIWRSDNEIGIAILRPHDGED